MRHHRLPTIAAVCVAAVLAACSPTTYDSTADTQPREATSTTLPTGTAAELLPLLLAEVQGLPTRVMNADGDGAAATRIEQLWAAVSAEIEATQPEFKNLTTLVQAYLG